MRFVETKTAEQQSCLMLHRTRHLFIRQQTAVINAIRAHLAELGIVAPVGRNGVEELLNVVSDAADKRVPDIARADECFWSRRSVSQRRVWSYLVVMLSPDFNHDLRLLKCVEDFTVQQIIAQFPVEAFAVAILLRTSGLDVRGFGSDSGDPFPKGNGDELRAVV